MPGVRTPVAAGEPGSVCASPRGGQEWPGPRQARAASRVARGGLRRGADPASRRARAPAWSARDHRGQGLVERGAASCPWPWAMSGSPAAAAAEDPRGLPSSVRASSPRGQRPRATSPTRSGAFPSASPMSDGHVDARRAAAPSQTPRSALRVHAGERGRLDPQAVHVQGRLDEPVHRLETRLARAFSSALRSALISSWSAVDALEDLLRARLESVPESSFTTRRSRAARRTAPSPVTASMRRTPAAMLVSTVTRNDADVARAAARACRRRARRSRSATATTRTSSPYFSPKSDIAPEALASSSGSTCVVDRRRSPGSSSFTRSSICAQLRPSVSACGG